MDHLVTAYFILCCWAVEFHYGTKRNQDEVSSNWTLWKVLWLLKKSSCSLYHDTVSEYCVAEPMLGMVVPQRRWSFAYFRVFQFCHAESVRLPTTELHCVIKNLTCVWIILFWHIAFSLCVHRSDVIWNEWYIILMPSVLCFLFLCYVVACVLIFLSNGVWVMSVGLTENNIL